MKHCCLFLLAFFLSLQGVGQKLRFNLVGCTVTKEEKASIEKMARYELAYYATVFPIRKIPVVQVYIYGNFDKFNTQQKSGPGYARSKSGFYSPRKKAVYVYKDSNFVRTCYHEISHFILATQLPNAPTWIDEGLAKYFQYAKVDSTGIQIRPWGYGKPRIQYLISRNRYNFEFVVKAPYRKFHKHRELDHYVESWALVYFLMSKDKQYVPEMLKGLKAGKKSIDVINELYKGGMEQLVKDVVAYYG